jgi:hypothetical protein
LGAIWGAHVTQDGVFTFRAKTNASAYFPETDGLCAMTIGAMYAVFPQFGIPTAEVDSLRKDLSTIRAAIGLRDSPDRDAPEYCVQ